MRSEVKTATLEAAHFYSRQYVSKHALSGDLGHWSVSAYVDPVLDMMVFDLHTYIYGQKVVDQTITYPADWWEAFKERWAPAWFLRRWAVRYKTVHIKLSEVYPEIRVPKEQYKIQIPIYERTERYWSSDPVEFWKEVQEDK